VQPEFELAVLDVGVSVVKADLTYSFSTLGLFKHKDVGPELA
jgi:hypothetical protein